jgi:hypothetical protein
MQILDLLGLYFDAAVIFVTNFSLLFRLTLAILCCPTRFSDLPPALGLQRLGWVSVVGGLGGLCCARAGLGLIMCGHCVPTPPPCTSGKKRAYVSSSFKRIRRIQNIV